MQPKRRNTRGEKLNEKRKVGDIAKVKKQLQKSAKMFLTKNIISDILITSTKLADGLTKRPRWGDNSRAFIIPRKVHLYRPNAASGGL